MSDINLEQVKALSKLDLNSEEERVIPEQMASILAYVDQLQGVDVSPTHSHRQALTSDSLRPDEARPCEDTTLLFENMPGRAGDLLEVPEVFAE